MSPVERSASCASTHHPKLYLTNQLQSLRLDSHQVLFLSSSLSTTRMTTYKKLTNDVSGNKCPQHHRSISTLTKIATPPPSSKHLFTCSTSNTSSSSRSNPNLSTNIFGGNEQSISRHSAGVYETN